MGKTRVAASVGDLVRTALLKAANSTGEVKLSGKEGGLFTSAAGTNKDAIAECLRSESPLLRVVRSEGKTQFVALSPAGFERIAGDLAEDQAGLVAKSIAEALSPSARIEFIQDTIRRTPLSATELTPLLESAVASERAEHEARVAAAAKRKALEAGVRAALERAIQLLDERRQRRLDALKREWEVEGGRASDLPALGRHVEVEVSPERSTRSVEPSSADEREFRRDVVHQLATAWRTAWDAQKHEAREYLESAIWNISGVRLIGEPNQQVAYNGRDHESVVGVGPGDSVRIVRSGWALEEPAGEYVVLKAVVAN
jgi:hypothetical protein